jgi:hypothetical protein
MQMSDYANGRLCIWDADNLMQCATLMPSMQMSYANELCKLLMQINYANDYNANELSK